MNIYDLYGLKVDNIEQAKLLLEPVLDVHFELRESMYIGEYYLGKINREKRYVIQNNYHEREGWIEEKYKYFNILLYVNDPPNPDELHKKIVNLSDAVCLLLRRITNDGQWRKELHFVKGQFKIVSEKKLLMI